MEFEDYLSELDAVWDEHPASIVAWYIQNGTKIMSYVIDMQKKLNDLLLGLEKIEKEL